MKVNFWQVLGIVLIIIGVIVVAWRQMGTGDTIPANNSPAATQAA